MRGTAGGSAYDSRPYALQATGTPMRRGSFLGLSALAVAAAPLAAPAQVNNAARAGRKALILVGGADRGAYQAGAIAALAEIQGVREGQPLDFDMVCGASIGALNGFMVATGQYAALQRIWRSVIASRDVFRLKSQFDAVEDPESGVLDRLAAAFRLSSGLTNNVRGILDPAPVREMLDEFADPATSTLLPLYISTTNLTRLENQMFVRKASAAAGESKQAVNDALLAAAGEEPRVVDDRLLHDVLFASAAIPLLFDPIPIAQQGDPQAVDYYVDGGVTQNVPIDIALHCADVLNLILVAPPRANVDQRYKNALEIGLGTFSAMQERIAAYQVRLAYALRRTHLPFTPYVIRPASELPNEGDDFSNQAELEAMWQLGYADMARGWQPFVPPDKLPFDSIY
jgi:predicted acylesterase/phospholipase RssA